LRRSCTPGAAGTGGSRSRTRRSSIRSLLIIELAETRGHRLAILVEVVPFAERHLMSGNIYFYRDVKGCMTPT
jgi:hypothetical protein